MPEMTIGDRLLESCQELYNNGVIERNQYKQCIDSMDSGEYFKKIQISERNIFSSSREEKEKKYNNFIKSVGQVIDAAYEKLKTLAKNSAKLSTQEQKQQIEKYNRVVVQVVILIQNVIQWIQSLSVKRHQNSEQQHYDQLLYYYNKIDEQRKELDKIKKQFNTLEKKSEHQDYKTKGGKSSYSTSINIMISLIVLVIICLVIIFLLYFI